MRNKTKLILSLASLVVIPILAIIGFFVWKDQDAKSHFCSMTGRDHHEVSEIRYYYGGSFIPFPRPGGPDTQYLRFKYSNDVWLFHFLTDIKQDERKCMTIPPIAKCSRVGLDIVHHQMSYPPKGVSDWWNEAAAKSVTEAYKIDFPPLSTLFIDRVNHLVFIKYEYLD